MLICPERLEPSHELKECGRRSWGKDCEGQADMPSKAKDGESNELKECGGRNMR